MNESHTDSDTFYNLNTFTFPAKPEHSYDIDSLPSSLESSSKKSIELSPRTSLIQNHPPSPHTPSSYRNSVFSAHNYDSPRSLPSPKTAKEGPYFDQLSPISPCSSMFQETKSPSKPIYRKSMGFSEFSFPNNHNTSYNMHHNPSFSNKSIRRVSVSSIKHLGHRRSLSISSNTMSIDSNSNYLHKNFLPNKFEANNDLIDMYIDPVKYGNGNNYDADEDNETDKERLDDDDDEEEDRNNLSSSSYSMLIDDFDNNTADVKSSSSSISTGVAQKVYMGRPSVVYVVSSPNSCDINLNVIDE